MLGVRCRTGSPLVVASRGCSPDVVCRLLLSQSTGSRVHSLQWLQRKGSVVAVPGLWSTGSIALVHKLSCSSACCSMESFRTRDGTSVPCIGRWILYPEPPEKLFFFSVCLYYYAESFVRAGPLSTTLISWLMQCPMLCEFLGV